MFFIVFQISKTRLFFLSGGLLIDIFLIFSNLFPKFFDLLLFTQDLLLFLPFCFSHFLEDIFCLSDISSSYATRMAFYNVDLSTAGKDCHDVGIVMELWDLSDILFDGIHLIKSFHLIKLVQSKTLHSIINHTMACIEEHSKVSYFWALLKHLFYVFCQVEKL